MDDTPSESYAKSRGRIHRTLAAALSSLRRYPPALVASFLEQETDTPRPLRDLLAELAPHGFAVCWLGHASVVVTLGDLTVVVDPVLSDRIGVRMGGRTYGLARRTPAPVTAGALLGVDAVLITHAHFDHLDRPTLAALADPRTTVVVPHRCARLVPDGFARVIELAHGHTLEIRGASIRSIKPRHWGARAWFDRRRGYCAYELKHSEGSVLFAGDTADTNVFDGLRGLDLGVFGIGAYEPWEHMHATPEQVWRMFVRSGARYLLPVHHSTFELSDEPMEEPLGRLFRAAGGAGDCVIREAVGEVCVIGGAQPPHTEAERRHGTSRR
ncbi:MAG: MBL fold metallo-hydrolase [Phycisphaerales bacterium]